MHVAENILLCAFLFCAQMAYFNCEILPDDSVLTTPWNGESLNELKQPHEIIYPVLVSGRRRSKVSGKKDIAETLACGLKECFFTFQAEHRRFVLFVQQNQFLLSQNGQYNAIIDSVMNVQPLWRGQCYYQGIVVEQPNSSVSLSTCHGLRGTIILENNTYLILPLNPHNSTSYPHAFVSLATGSKTRGGILKPYHLQEPYLNPLVAQQMRLNNYVELSLIIDKDMVDQMKLNFEDLFYFLFDVANTLDLLLQQIHLRISIVHAEVWVNKNLIDIAEDAFATLDNLAQALTNRIDGNPTDVAMLLSAASASKSQLAVFTNSVCTTNATGVIRISGNSHPLYASQVMMYAIGNILGVLHSDNGTKRGRKYGNKIMETGYKSVQCSWLTAMMVCRILRMGELTERTYLQIYQRTHYLRQSVLALAFEDEGECLLNLPFQRNAKTKCGNGVVDEGEECDCGTEIECEQVDPCCVPLKCQLKQGAQCSAGPCCDRCMFSSEKKVCRPFQDEYCDLSEYCSATSSMCPANSYKQDGTTCGPFSEGYCYKGKCQSASDQCHETLGPGYSMANAMCFRKMNMMGTVFGHCGIDAQGNPIACSSKDYFCGVLFCQRNVASLKSEDFSKYRVLGQKVIECSISASYFLWNVELVKDGTKCGTNKMCYAHSCVSINQFQRNVSCPTNNTALTCSGHGSCTNLNTCLCDAGWSLHDCSFKLAANEISAQYFNAEKDRSGEWFSLKLKNEKSCLELSNGALSIAACCIGIITCVVMLFYLIHTRRFKSCYSPRKAELRRVKNELADVILMRTADAGINYNRNKAFGEQDSGNLRSIVEASAISACKNSGNSHASDVSRSMDKWTAPKLRRNNSYSSLTHKSNSLKELFSNDRGRNSVCSISKYIELTQKHFRFLVDLHDDGNSTVKKLHMKNAPQHSSFYPSCGVACQRRCFRCHHCFTNSSMIPGYGSTALICTNPSTVYNENSDMPSTSCHQATRAIFATSVCSFDMQEDTVFTNQGNGNGKETLSSFLELHVAAVNSEGRPVSILLDDVILVDKS